MVASTYYSGDKSDLYGEEIAKNIFVIRLDKDSGSGLLTNVDAYLVDNGKIVESLNDKKTGKLNESFWSNIEKLRKNS